MHEKAVLERIRSLQVDDDAEENYVHVYSEKGLHDITSNWEPEGLAVTLVESWQSKLLQDPKNRFVIPPPSHA